MQGIEILNFDKILGEGIKNKKPYYYLNDSFQLLIFVKFCGGGC